MNKAEMTRQYVKQTAEHERNLEQERKKNMQEIKASITAMMESILMVIQNQGKIANYSQKHLPEIILII